MNKVVLMGRLTKDPEVRYSNSERPMTVARYTLAVKRRYSKEGEADADFIHVVAFGRNGEYAKNNFTKGQMVSIIGRIHQDVWEDTEHIKRSRVEIIADEQQKAESASVSGAGNDKSEQKTAVAAMAE